MSIDPDKLEAVRLRLAGGTGCEVLALDPGSKAAAEYRIGPSDRGQLVRVSWERFVEYATATEILDDQALHRAKFGESFLVGVDSIEFETPP